MIAKFSCCYLAVDTRDATIASRAAAVLRRASTNVNEKIGSKI